MDVKKKHCKKDPERNEPFGGRRGKRKAGGRGEKTGRVRTRPQTRSEPSSNHKGQEGKASITKGGLTLWQEATTRPTTAGQPNPHYRDRRHSYRGSEEKTRMGVEDTF